MPQDDPSAYTPQQIAQKLLESGSPQELLEKLESFGWELQPTGVPAEDSLEHEEPKGEAEGEMPMAEDEMPMPPKRKPPYVMALRIAAVDKAFKKHSKKDNGEEDHGR